MKESILIIGAGHQGLAMAGHFALNGENVKLWNRTAEHIKDIAKTKTIICEGAVKGEAKIEEASTDMSALISKRIFVTVPSLAYKDVARELAGVLLSESVIFLNPGRTFGAIEFIEELKKNGCREIPAVIETQSIVYTCRRTPTNFSHIYALKSKVKMAALGRKITKSELFDCLPECVRDRFILTESFLNTSLGNIGMVLHCAPVLMNTGWIESTEHSFKYYYDGLSKSVCGFVEKIDNQRMAVASAMGADCASLIEWFEECYGIRENDIYSCIRKNEYYREIDAPNSLEHRYLDEDIPNGLVPVEALGLELGIDVSSISLIIDFANSVKNTDYRVRGRRYSLSKINSFLS